LSALDEGGGTPRPALRVPGEVAEGRGAAEDVLEDVAGGF
jgi:hypothetical protein